MGRRMPVIHATRKPTTIQAMELSADPREADDLIAWVLSYGAIAFKIDPNVVAIHTIDGNVANVMPGWYVVRGTQGEFYPVKKDIFESVYDVIDREYS